MSSINFFSEESRNQVLMMLKNENISKSSLHFQKRFLVNIIISLIWTCLWTGLSLSARYLTLGSQVESDQSVSGHTESQSALCQRGDKMFFSHNPLRRSLNDHAFLPQQRQLPGKEYLVEWKKFLNIVISLRGERSFKRCIENLFNFSFKNWVKIILLQSQAWVAWLGSQSNWRMNTFGRGSMSWARRWNSTRPAGNTIMILKYFCRI